jgi:hypothetical protein
MSRVEAVQRTLRIDNVEAAPVERITANDEERVRQGFDIQTVFSWPKRDGRVHITEADFRCDDTSILHLQYGNSAEINRTSDEAKQMLVDLARGQVVLAAAPDQASEGSGWAAAFKEAGLPPLDASAVSFAGQDIGFAWRSHFVAASSAPISKATRDEAEARGWTLFELPESVPAGVPDYLISMFGGSTQ